MTGEDPEHSVIDHQYDYVDSVYKSNYWWNLRKAGIENGYNRKLGSNNTSGYKGVRFIKGREGRRQWMAQIWANGKRVGLGYYYTAQEAAEAYNKASKELHKEFARPNSFP